MGTRHKHDAERISTHAPAGGATLTATFALSMLVLFLLTPLREGRRPFCRVCHKAPGYFYSRPCGRGDLPHHRRIPETEPFLLTPLREGRRQLPPLRRSERHFYSRPCGRGDVVRGSALRELVAHFYSRPCGRGDGAVRSGRRGPRNFYSRPCGRGDSRGLHRPGHRKGISTHAPAGGATRSQIITSAISSHFYSRPCGRGDPAADFT